MMDEKSILLMSEELRAAMGSGVKRLESPVQADRADEVRIEGRVIKFAALKSGRAKLVLEVRGSHRSELLPGESTRSVTVSGVANLSLASVRIVSVTVDDRRARRITLILETVGPK